MSGTMEPRATERTPLIAVVRVAPPRQRYKHHRVRRICNFLICIMLMVGVVGYLFPLIFNVVFDTVEKISGHHVRAILPWYHPYPPSWPDTQGVDIEELVEILKATPKPENIRNFSKYYTSGPHLVGQNLSQALWTRDRWIESGIENTNLASYEIWLNYHQDHRLALYEQSTKPGIETSKKDWTVKYEASLEEDVLDEDPTSGLKDRIPTYHAYSMNGNVTASYVFANYGTFWDFEDLLKANVTLKGKIALVKYGKIYRGLKVTRAEELGMVGVIMYSDPGDDGEYTAEKGIKEYPEGGARQPSSVQRGSVALLNRAMGDPTTPGYPSKPGAPRAVPGHELPRIPSLPISYKDALPLLKALNGHGIKASSINKYWHGGGLGYRGVEYNVGPSPDNLKVTLVNEQRYTTTPIWNVIGVINGTSSDEVVIVGNHRDAWIAGGAGDPNSGTAVLDEMVRAYGLALQTGWKPRRTLVFASWDGEEYALLGSSEWVEEYVPWLSGAAITYLNVDVAVSGSKFHVSANPLLEDVFKKILHTVSVEDGEPDSTPVWNYWDGVFRTLGSGSDFAAFQEFAGIPAIDMGFARGPTDPVYHYHSNYDSFHWMDTFGDPGWHRHVAIAQLWSLLALAYVENAVIPFNIGDYAVAIRGYIEAAAEKAFKHDIGQENEQSVLEAFRSLAARADELNRVALIINEEAYQLNRQLRNGIPWWKWWEKVQLWFKAEKINLLLKHFDRNFLYEPGLDERSQFKHVIFAPGFWTGYSGVALPGILETIDNKNWTNTKRWCGIVEEKLHQAQLFLS